MTKTILGLLPDPYYMITLHFDPSFTNAGILRLETTDGRTKTFEWNLPSELDATSSITAYDYHQGPLDGHLVLNMLSGNAKITSIEIVKVIPETTVFGTTRGRYYELEIDPVPEPGTGLLLGYGLATFGFRRWRGNRQIQA